MHLLSWLLEVSSKDTKYFLDTMNKTLWVSQTSELNLYIQFIEMSLSTQIILLFLEIIVWSANYI